MAKLINKKIVPYKGKVYDLTVENSHSYNVEGISVHNSAAGCLLSYCLEITKIDPIKFGLYFERFLNPSRKGAPDIDLDFTSGTEHIVKDFLVKKYGKERVMPVGTYLTFNEKGCLKDVIRSHFGHEYTGKGSDADILTKEMPTNWAKVDFDLKWWFENWAKDPKCTQRVRMWLTDPQNKIVIQQTLQLQGQIRSLGQHAAGMVITPSASWEYMPVNAIPKSGEIVSAFQEADKSGKYLSELGILKLDILKLTTLNITQDTIRMVKENEGIDIQKEIDHIENHFKDPALYEDIKGGMNHGVFQFESDGMNVLLRDLDVDRFEELAAANALYRPGAKNAIPEFVANKFEKDKITYPHPLTEDALKETNGLLVFQEQMMFIAKAVGGMSLGEGDNLRRAMEKAAKIIEKEANKNQLDEKEKNDPNYLKFKELWGQFLDGAKKNGLNEKEVDNIRDYLLKYLGYSFNKCLTKNHTVISKERGSINIIDAIEGEEILCFNPTTYKNEFNKVKKIHVNGVKSVYRFNLEFAKKLYDKERRFLECTLDHKVMTSKDVMTPIGELLLDIEHNLIVAKHFNSDDQSLLYRIESVDKIGEQETYDLEIDSESHNYYANGICVSNSHSVSYAYIAMQTLYLKHYHPAEFYCALLNHSKGSGPKEEQQEWLFRAIASAMAKGIKILPPSKKAAWDWKVTDKNEITAGFSTINGFGDIAFEELMRLLKEKGKTLQSITPSMFFSLTFSKYNKSAFEASIKAGVFDDWSKSREYLKFLKSKKKKKPTQNQTVLFDIDEISSIDMSKEKNYEITSERQKEEEFKEACGFSLLELNRISKIKQQIQKKTARQKKPVYAITDFEEEGNYYFILNDFQIKKSANGNEYVEMLVGDGIKNTKIRAFAEMKDRVAPFLERKAVYMSQFMKNEKGYTNFKRGAKFKKIIEADSDEIIIEKQNQPTN